MNRRKIDSTNMNLNSSSFHFLFTFDVSRITKADEKKRFKINVIDLAGSENLVRAREPRS